MLHLYLMLGSAIVPVTLMLLLGRAHTRRTKIKVIALSAYLYIFWQMLPEINLYVVTADLAAVAAIFMVGRARKHKAKDAVSKGPISKLWE